ncbi:MAG: hypothetical protein R3A50_09580 [Saprospiraceae bacterium]
MKQRILIALHLMLLVSFSSCVIFPAKVENSNEVGRRVKTNNPAVPCLYKNGYKNYEIKPFLSKIGRDSIYINELRFNAAYMYICTGKALYDKFGRWDKYLRACEDCGESLIWENVKLFKDSDELYTIAASGAKNCDEVYASVVIFNTKQEDCLAESYEKREAIIEHFSKAIRHLNHNMSFYRDIYYQRKDFMKINQE